MASSGGKDKPDKALKEKQNKLTLMEKVLHRDKHDKTSKKEREAKAASKDLETVAKEGTEEQAAEEGKGKGKGKTKEKESFMDKVRLRDKSDKHGKKERDSKSGSKDLETKDKEDEDGGTSADTTSKHKMSLMDKVFMRDRSDRLSKRDRQSKVPSLDLDVAREEAEAAESEEVEDKHQRSSFMDKVKLRHERMGRKERDFKASSKVSLDAGPRSTSLVDLSAVDLASVPLRGPGGAADRTARKEKNRRSGSSVVK